MKYGKIHETDCGPDCPGDPGCPNTELARLKARADAQPSMQYLSKYIEPVGLRPSQAYWEHLYCIVSRMQGKIPAASVWSPWPVQFYKDSKLERETYKFHCVVCGDEYTGFNSHQASGCAAELRVEEKCILGHYGSKHDISKYVLKIDLNEGQKSGPVCDECIDVWLAAESLLDDGEYYDWD